jgi:hypothetical protein
LAAAAILITSGWGARGREHARTVRAIRQAQPGLVILIATADPDALDWKSIAHAGADDVVVVGGQANARNLSRLVADRLATPVHEEALRDILVAGHNAFCTRFVSWCLRNATAPRSVQTMAEWFRESERSLRRHLTKGGLPGASLIWRCGRILYAQRLREVVACSQEEAARRVGYTDAAVLRSVRKELRDNVALDEIAMQFVAAIRGLAWSLPDGGRGDLDGTDA